MCTFMLHVLYRYRYRYRYTGTGVHVQYRRDGDVYVNQGEEYALRLLELEANFLSIFWIFLIYKNHTAAVVVVLRVVVE